MSDSQIVDPMDGASRYLYLRIWQRVPLPVRATVAGVAVFFVGQTIGGFITLLNVEVAERVPWSLAPAGLWLVLYWKYCGGWGPPHHTAALRAASMRATHPPPRVWLWSLASGLTGAVALFGIVLVSMRLAGFGEEALAPPIDISELPPWTLWSVMASIAIFAGVTEEVGFRGYMQAPLERRYGPGPAILLTSLLFFSLHLGHPYIRGTGAAVLGGGLLLGIIAYLARSIWPGVIVHTALDLFAVPYRMFGKYDLSPIPKGELDGHLAVSLSLVVLGAVAATVSLFGLARVAREEFAES